MRIAVWSNLYNAYVIRGNWQRWNRGIVAKGAKTRRSHLAEISLIHI